MKDDTKSSTKCKGFYLFFHQKLSISHKKYVDVIEIKMARILLISLYDINAEGLRMMSSILKMEGHDPHIIFLKNLQRGPVRNPKTDWIGIAENGKTFQHAMGNIISKKEEEILISTIRKICPDLIGFSVCSPIAPVIENLSHNIRSEFSMPLIWGGPHPTMRPGDCIKHCDYICIGEADSIISKIARYIDLGLDLRNISGLISELDDIETAIQPSPLIEDLDSLPFKDISPNNKYFIENNNLDSDFSGFSYSQNYHLISSRGCLFRCSYCCEDTFKRLYHPLKLLRRRSAGHVVTELKHAIDLLKFKAVHFEDEFFSFDISWIENFCSIYKEEIGLPFTCYIYPIRDIKNHISILKNAGLISTVLSLQSGSERINQTVYNRVYDRETFLACARLLHEEKIRYSTDIISYNPLETEQDLLDTLNVLIELPKPFWLDVNKLYIFKGTEIEKITKTSTPDEQVPERIINLYTRLYWLTRFNKYIAIFAGYLRSLTFIRKKPVLLNPQIYNLPYNVYYRLRILFGHTF